MTWGLPAAAIASCGWPMARSWATNGARWRSPHNDVLRMSLALKLARREMRSGLGGFRLFLACLALGVGAIAAILSFSRAIEEGLRADARELMGGDVAISLLYHQATAGQLAFLRQQGQLVHWVDMRSMARPEKRGASATLVQLKAVEPAYPLYGSVELRGGGTLSE